MTNGDPVIEGQNTALPLTSLELDGDNPRFGRQAGAFSCEADILDYIVDNFGVDTLLSSLAYNGYFDAEPIIVRNVPQSRFRVVEGNRRLAACLILAGDPRARNQVNRSRFWKDKTKGAPWTQARPVPVRIFDTEDELERLLPYLGVRHIVSSQPWDSYAKAKWIADVICRGGMTLEQIAEVTGDKNRTIERLLEGYYVVNQLAQNGKFNSKHSVRRGRGSNPEYPFSWVYTLLGSRNVRDWLGLGERAKTQSNPIAPENLDNAGETLRYLFGDTSTGRNPAIKDSREIVLLASALSSAEKRSLLRQGKSAAEIDRLARPAQDQLADFLTQADTALTQAYALVGSAQLPRSELRDLRDKAEHISTLAEALYHAIAIGKTKLS